MHQRNVSTTQSTSSGPPASVTFTSAHKHGNVVDRPAYRRRGSAGANDGWRDDSNVYRSGHLRARTVDHGARHPLGATSPPSGMADSTRPRLQRLTSIDADPDGDWPSAKKADPIAKSDDVARYEVEKTVLVHNVSPQDSLPGVALRYGVTLAELRRANKLWAADSIHLRKVLYIPLDKAAQLALLAPPTPSSSSSATGEMPPPPPAATDGYASEAPDSAPQSRARPEPEIRRIPASELSFFPPPSARSALPASTSSTPIRRTQTLPRLRHVSSPSSSTTLASLFPAQAPTFSSLLQALPIPLARAPPGRTSFDSARSGSSPSSAVSDQEHELADVSRRPSPERGARTPTSTVRRLGPRWPANHESDVPASVVRAQMAPSPVMQVPPRTSSKTPLRDEPRTSPGVRAVR